MKKEQVQILHKVSEICDNMATAISKRNNGQPYCRNYCPGEDKLIEIVNQLILVINDKEPECCKRLNAELQNIKRLPNQCVNPYSFGAIAAIIDVLKNKYLSINHKKFFISHSSLDKIIINSFIKEILKIGCGFKDSDIFCTLDPSSIRTGDDFREKIVENMRECDFILLFISENYNLSDVCKNEMGAAWTLERKRIMPFVLPNIGFDQMGFLNIVKQGASIIEKRKLDEFYNEICNYYSIQSNWPEFNKAKEDFIETINRLV